MVEQRTPNPRVGGSSPSCPARQRGNVNRPPTMGPNKFVHLMFALGGAAGGVHPFARRPTGRGATSPSPTIWSSTALRWSSAGTAAIVAYRNEQVYASVVDVTRELEKVTWPTRKETSAATVVVIVTVLISALILSSFDVTLVITSQTGSLRLIDEGSPMPMKWYVVHTYSGHENKAKLSLLDRVRQAALTEKFGDILIPTDTVVELVKGQKRSTTRKFFPGYMFVQMDLDQETFHLVKNTPEDHRVPGRHQPAAGQGDGDPEHQRRHDRRAPRVPSRASPSRRARRSA